MISLIAVLLSVVFTTVSSLQDTEGPHEYCSFENFNATCDPNHVVVMTSARYGRMRLGKCVTKNLGYMGCVAEVLDVLDKRCTGRQTCDISVSDPELRAKKPCPNDVTWHLEVSYKCVPVITPSNPTQCHYRDNNKPILLNSTHFLSSMSSVDSGYGTMRCPWKLAVKDGQTISVSVYDTLSLAGGAGGNVCYTLGVVTENTKPTTLTVCPDDLQLARNVVLYLSKTGHVELSLYAGNQHVPYLLQVDVEGCPNITLPAHATAKRSSHKLQFKCNNSDNTWSLICQNNKWQGVMGNCSIDPKGSWAMQHILQDGNILPMGILIAVALGVALGIFLGGLLLVIVGARMKKRQRQRMQQAAFVDVPDYDIREDVPQRFSAKSPGGGTLSSTMEYTLSRGTENTTVTSEGDRPYTYRKTPTYPTREGEQLKCCASPYHAYETPTMT